MAKKRGANPLGSNTTLLGIRVNNVTAQMLLLMAGSKEKIPDLLRQWILIHTFPLVFRATLLDLEKRPGEESTGRFEFLLPQAKACQDELDKLIASCDSIQKIKEKAIATKRKLAELETQGLKIYDDMLEEADEETKDMEKPVL